MNFETIKYEDYIKRIPVDGRCILGLQSQEEILVYQAYNHAIADFAIENQFFGGDAYSYARMSWIKPNFLWMMYRCGWASKMNQERVLGIWIKKSDFDIILNQSVFSSFNNQSYESRDHWKKALEDHPVRLQWDPDHDIYGNKQDRKAIQLGIKGKLLVRFGKEMICKIFDATKFVKQQKILIDNDELDNLILPKEKVYLPENELTRRRIGIE